MALRRLPLLLVAFLLCGAGAACGGVSSDDTADGGGDADADSDGDGDADADADGDGDSDTDSDGDSDADSDGDTDADSDGDSDADSDADADSDGDGDADCDEVACDDLDECTIDFCDANGNCIHDVVPGCRPCRNAAECDDGDACNGREVCKQDLCEPGPAPDCDDGDACTDDACDPDVGCFWNGVDCDDDDVCTIDSCHRLTGCGHVMIPLCQSCRVDSECDDGDTCNGLESCVDERCAPGQALGCGDGDMCTTDWCDPDVGCVWGLADCNDGSACTVDACDSLLGCVWSELFCDDSDACTVDWCDGASGCQTTAVDCNDFDPCTADSCDWQRGCYHEDVVCDDNDPCTFDFCEAANNGCQSQPLCRDDEYCLQGACFLCQAPIADNQTVALWHFDEGGGQMAMDSSPAGTHTGFLGGAVEVEADDPVWTAAGRFGAALSFTRADEDHVYSSVAGAFPTNAASMEAWIRPTAPYQYSQFFTAGFINFIVAATGNGAIDMGIGDGDGWTFLGSAPAGVDDGAWHHVAATYDGATMRIYVDGEQVAERDAVVDLADPAEWYLGGRPSNTFLNGDLDEVRVSDVARSPEEIFAAACGN